MHTDIQATPHQARRRNAKESISRDRDLSKYSIFGTHGFSAKFAADYIFSTVLNMNEIWFEIVSNIFPSQN